MSSDNEIKQTFAERLKGLREAAELSQGELAEELGVSRGSISYYENCSRVPDIVFLNHAAEYFGVGVNFLMGGTENQDPKNEDLGSRIGFTDAAIQKLRNDETYGVAISRIIEDERFDSLFHAVDYFFDPFSYGYCQNDPYREVAGLYANEELEFSIFQISRILTSILLDIKDEVTTFFIDRFTNEFTQSDRNRAQFLQEKAAHERATTNQKIKEIEANRARAMQDLEDLYAKWEHSDECKKSERKFRAVSEYVAGKSTTETITEG